MEKLGHPSDTSKDFNVLRKKSRELEEKEEVKILVERIARLENNPAAGVPWRSVRRSR